MKQNSEARSQKQEEKKKEEKERMKEKAYNFRQLTVWRKAHELVLYIYRLTENFPNVEKFGLTSQIRRSAVSIPANIAEGFCKRSKLDKLRLLNIAQGSLEETRYYLILAKDLGYYADPGDFNLLEEVSKLLEGYMKAIRKDCSKS